MSVPAAPPALDAADLRFRYPRAAEWTLAGISLAVQPGELVGLLGANGAGKTTLLRLLGGLAAPAAGTVRCFGASVAELPPRERARRLAFVPQDSHPAFDLVVGDLVLLGRTPHLGWMGIEGPRDRARAREALAETGTLELAGRRFGTLSAGERQRVVLARALAQEAPVVLLDEPTTHLDLAHQIRLFELLARLRAERKTTFVVASHDLSLAGRWCDRLVLLAGGRVLAAGPPPCVLEPGTLRAAYGVDAEVIFPFPDSGPVVIARGTAAGSP